MVEWGFSNGAVAQLGERRVRNAKVGSSILLGSTNPFRYRPHLYSHLLESGADSGALLTAAAEFYGPEEWIPV